MTRTLDISVRPRRGMADNPPARFESWVPDRSHEYCDEGWLDDHANQRHLWVDASRSVVTRNDSPDVPFSYSINPYRGCEHGCVYCFARPSHAYLGFSPGLDFERHLVLKPDAARHLRAHLARASYRCEPIALGTNTDPYQQVERDAGITRTLLEVFCETRHPVEIVTKSAMIERDVDLIADLAAQGLVRVHVSVTSLEATLSRRMEPRASVPRRRLQILRRLAERGIPTGVLVVPVIPGLTDMALEEILRHCREAGAQFAAYVLLRLPAEVGPMFEAWLRRTYPHRAEHVLSLVRDCHGGRLYDPRFGQRMTGVGGYADMLAQRFRLARRRCGYQLQAPALRDDLFRPPGADRNQLDLF